MRIDAVAPVPVSRTARPIRAEDPRSPAVNGARVAELSQRDAHVRAHEAAHQAAGGSLTGGATFSYASGPDGRQYAIGGEVPVQLGKGSTPEETIRIAAQARAAALAPMDPSPADLSVAAAAAQLEAQARAGLARRAAAAYGATPGADGGSRQPVLDGRAPSVWGA